MKRSSVFAFFAWGQWLFGTAVAFFGVTLDVLYTIASAAFVMACAAYVRIGESSKR